MRFEKFEALGNDFIIVRETEAGDSPDFSQLALRLCDRHFGVGADGVEIVLDRIAPTGNSDVAVRLYNSDGGETPISGNGTRCVAAWLFQREIWTGPGVRIATGAGTKKLSLKRRLSDSEFEFEMEMGKPRLASTEIPVVLDSPLNQVVGQTLDLNSGMIKFTATSMGNPHCSVLVDDFGELNWQKVGAEIEGHRRFPDRTNVEFVRIIDRGTIEVRFWERGVGRTLASGTGSCGAALAAMLNEKTGRQVRVLTEAGELKVEWREDGMVCQTGKARYVFSGDWPLKSEAI